MIRVLVTRPEPGAGATARRLAEGGFEPLVLPLTETRPVAVEPWPSPAQFDAVAVTSAAALRHAPPGMLASLAHLPCFAVGASTAETAGRAGFARVHAGEGNADALARHVLRALSPKRGILFLCGRVRLDTFEDRLAAGGLAVTPVESYDTISLDLEDAPVLRALGDRPLDAVLIHSAYSASAVASLAARTVLRPYFVDAAYLCLAQRFGDNLSGIATDRIHVAERPADDSLLALLSRLCGKTP